MPHAQFFPFSGQITFVLTRNFRFCKLQLETNTFLESIDRRPFTRPDYFWTHFFRPILVRGFVMFFVKVRKRFRLDGFGKLQLVLLLSGPNDSKTAFL